MPSLYNLCVQLRIDPEEIAIFLDLREMMLNDLSPSFIQKFVLTFELDAFYPRLFETLVPFSLFQPISLKELASEKLEGMFDGTDKKVFVFKYSTIRADRDHENEVKKTKKEFFAAIPKPKRKRFAVKLQERKGDPEYAVTARYIVYLCEFMDIESASVLAAFERYQNADETCKDHVNEQWYARYGIIFESVERALRFFEGSQLEFFIKLCPDDLMDQIDFIDDRRTLQNISSILKLTDREAGRFINQRIPLVRVRENPSFMENVKRQHKEEEFYCDPFGDPNYEIK